MAFFIYLSLSQNTKYNSAQKFYGKREFTLISLAAFVRFLFGYKVEQINMTANIELLEQLLAWCSDVIICVMRVFKEVFINRFILIMIKWMNLSRPSTPKISKRDSIGIAKSFCPKMRQLNRQTFHFDYLFKKFASLWQSNEINFYICCKH